MFFVQEDIQEDLKKYVHMEGGGCTVGHLSPWPIRITWPHSQCQRMFCALYRSWTKVIRGLSQSKQYDIWIYNYLWTQCLSTHIVSLNPAHGEVYSIQHCVIKFVSDLWQVGGFLWVLWFPPPIKLIVMIQLKYC